MDTLTAITARADCLQPAPRLTLMHVRQSPHAGHLAQDVIAWMDQYGLLCDSEKLDRVIHMDIDIYAGYSYPGASEADLLIYAKYIVLWLFWDDFVIEKGGGASDAIYRIFSLRETPALKDRYMRAWWSVMSDLRSRSGSQDVVEWVARSMRTWFKAAVLERERARFTELKDFESYFDTRLKTIGMVQTALLLEIFAGISVPDSTEKRAMVRDSCAIVGVSNELVSHSKDRDWINLIDIYSQTHACGIDDARARLIEMHDHAVVSLDDSVKRSSGNVRVWGESLQFCAEGFSYWHTVCARYAGSRVNARIVDGGA